VKIFHLAPLVFAALFAACTDATAPAPVSSLRPTATPSALLGPDEGVRMITDSVDARGTTIMVAEYAAGVTLNDPTSSPIGSVVIQTIIPLLTPGSSKTPCITSTIVRTETVAGWTASVKKPGGCDKEIQVQFENNTTRQRADFSFLYLFGKTRIDSGLIK
jgi:hypothetical protein